MPPSTPPAAPTRNPLRPGNLVRATVLRRVLQNLDPSQKATPSPRPAEPTSTKAPSKSNKISGEVAETQVTKNDLSSNKTNSGSPDSTPSNADHGRPQATAIFEQNRATLQDHEDPKDQFTLVTRGRKGKATTARTTASQSTTAGVPRNTSFATRAAAASTAAPRSFAPSRNLPHQTAASVAPRSSGYSTNGPPAPKAFFQKSKAFGLGLAASISAQKSEIIRKDDNWRVNKPELGKQLTELTCELRMDKTTFTKGTFTHGPRTPFGVPYSSQAPGAILRHPDIRNIRTTKDATGGWKPVTQPDSRLTKVKGRCWLVVAADDRQVSEVAIYTNDDTGLAKIPKSAHRHYCSVCPHGMPLHTFKNLSPGNEVLQADWISDAIQGQPMQRKTMVANMSEVKVRTIHYPGVLKVIGTLRKESTEYAVSKSMGTAKSK